MQKASYSPIEALIRMADQDMKIVWFAEDVERLCGEVDDFARRMKIELVDRALQGRKGWNAKTNPTWNYDIILERARKHMLEGQLIGAANLLMFAAYQSRKEAEKLLKVPLEVEEP